MWGWVNLLGDDIIGGLGHAASGDLGLGENNLLLDGRAAGAGAALEVVGEARVLLVAGGVLRQVFVDGELQIGLAQALVAVARVSTGCGSKVSVAGGVATRRETM